MVALRAVPWPVVLGAARVRVADVGGKEFKEADARLVAGGGDQGRNRKGARGQGDELVHINPTAGTA
jgi:hypothetical protein